MNLEQLQKKMGELLDEAKALGQKRTDNTFSDDDAKRAGVLTTEIAEVGKAIDTLTGNTRNMEQLAQVAAAYAKAPAKAAPVNEDPNGVGRIVTPGSIRAFMDTDKYKRVSMDGHGETGGFKLGPEHSFYARANPAGFSRDYPEEAKTLVYEGATSNLILPDRIPGIFRGDPIDRRARDAFLAGRTDGTSISYVSENSVTNAAAGIVEATGITAGAPTPPGSAFPESAITFVVASETVKSIGHMIPVTKEMLADVALMESYLRDRMVEMVDDKVDDQLLNGAGGNDLVGLANVSGLSVLDAPYFSSNPVESFGDPAENADRLRRARTYLRLVARARATDAIINPYDLEAIETARDANGNYIWSPTGGPNGTIESRIGGMRVIEAEGQAIGTAYVVARTAFGVFDRMDTVVEVTDANRNWFEHRILALAVWTRLAFVAFRPAAAAKVTLV